ncbi:hypothetical protein ACOYA6_09195 [Leclercia barmai]|uniref:hypothetical protein n=1 Tax=Leclercia barmai TaxID=2785629 RepID=UPI003BB95658
MGNSKISLENLGLSLGIVTKVSLFLGGVIFLVYCSNSGAFPEDLSLGDGIWLLLIISVFTFGMAIVYFFLGCLGISLCHVIYHALRFSGVTKYFISVRKSFRERKMKTMLKKNGVFYRAYKREEGFMYNVRFPKISFIYHMLSLFTLILIFSSVKSDHCFWYLRIILSSISLGFLFLFLHINRRKYLQIDHVGVCKDECKRLKGEIKLTNAVVTMTALIFSTIYLGIISIAANKTMVFLHIRNEKVTVFVKQPWDAVLDRHLSNSTKHIKGDNVGQHTEVVPGYKQYDDLTVSLYNLGSSVFLEFPVGKKLYSLKIPSSDIIVDGVPVSRH